MKKIILTSIVASSVVMAAGYKLPETSANSVALSGANIAHVKSADAAYDNPANMSFMSSENHLEADLMYIGTSATNFKGDVSVATGQDLDSEAQTFMIPSLHYVSPEFGNTRVGMSVVVPGGLTREWKTEPAKTSAEEFTLQIVELNPSVSYKVDDTLSLAVGVRALHTSGVVKSDGTAAIAALGGAANVSRDMTGDSIDFGYNLALAYKPTSEMEVALAYRSQVDLTVEGNAKLGTSVLTGPAAGAVYSYSGDATVTIPLPASLHLAFAYTLASKTTVEVVYEKTFWSSYKELDFDYDGTEHAVLAGVFGGSIPKNWEDTNTIRLGVTQELDELTLMAGVVLDPSPTPEATLGFESPGSDALAFSFGGRYAIDDSFNVGLGVLYTQKEDRKVTNTAMDGEFSNSNALLVSLGLGYKF